MKMMYYKADNGFLFVEVVYVDASLFWRCGVEHTIRGTVDKASRKCEDFIVF